MQVLPKVLVIDDEPGVRKFMERALSDFYSVFTAANGRQGLALAEQVLPQLIILDIHLPDFDGLSVLAKLKTNPATQAIPVVIASVRSESDLIFEAKQSGASDQLIKPFTVELLRETVKRNIPFDSSEPKPRSSAAGPAISASAGAKRLTVLVVDDEAGIQKLVQRALEPDYVVLTAATGQEGLYWARATCPDMILLDIQLPELDGMSVLARLKAEGRTASIPVVIISAHGSSELLFEGQHSGASDYLIKPFYPDNLREMVKRHIKIQ